MRTIIDVLLEQHARIEELFQLVETSKGRDKKACFEELAELLRAHEAAEEAVVHSVAMGSIDSGADVVEERLEEEEEAKELLARLSGMDIGGDEFDEEFQALRTAVLEHATREERYEFQQLKAAQPVEVLIEMGKRFEEHQRQS
jgi:hypothetical protein